MLVCPCSVLEAEMTTFIDYDDNQAAGFDWSTMYSVSPLLYPTIGTVITMVVALLLTIIPSQSQNDIPMLVYYVPLTFCFLIYFHVKGTW